MYGHGGVGMKSRECYLRGMKPDVYIEDLRIERDTQSACLIRVGLVVPFSSQNEAEGKAFLDRMRSAMDRAAKMTLEDAEEGTIHMPYAGPAVKFVTVKAEDAPIATAPADSFKALAEDDVTNFVTGDGRTVFCIRRGGRVFIDGEETTDVERIGAAFVTWAKVFLPKLPK